MKEPLFLQEYVSPNVNVMFLSVENVFVASAEATHEEYDAVDLFD